MKTSKAPTRLGPNPTKISALAKWATRVTADDDKPLPIQERLFKWSERKQTPLCHKRALQFQARTRLDSEDAVETLYFDPKNQRFYLQRSAVTRDDQWGESWAELTAREAVLWSIDRLFGPATFAAWKAEKAKCGKYRKTKTEGSKGFLYEKAN
jgi:hypothetical protein